MTLAHSKTSPSTDRGRRGTAMLELLLLVVALVSLTMFSLAVWRIYMADLSLRARMHDRVFARATGGHTSGRDAPVSGRRAFHAVSNGRYPAVPEDLAVGGLPNSPVNTRLRPRVAAKAGAFGLIGPIRLDRRGGALKEAWTYTGGTNGYTQSGSDTGRVRSWFANSIEKSIGRVDGPLKLAD
ncbi:MAG: hypothetical protein JSR77_13205 [Planctomycetes bacterium]|nr:hypothetical protein [Planctomycetota bacterium]